MNDMERAVSESLDNLIHGSDSRRTAGDYIGNDGLLYCGKCRTKKQTVVHLPAGTIFGDGGEKVVTCQCQCQQEYERKRKEMDAHREEMRLIQKRKDASMMDSKYHGAVFSAYEETPDNNKVLKVAKNYVRKFEDMYSHNQGILLYGPVGTGKSYTAACIANALLDQNISVIMTSFVKILQNIQYQNEADYIEMLNSAKLLILDDLGTERNTDFALEKVYNIIDSRSRASKPMILTTNLELSEMMDTPDIRYKRIYDRIFETCYPLKVPGKSFRRLSAEKRFDQMTKLMEG